MKSITWIFIAFFVFNVDTVIGSSRPVLLSQKMFSSGRRAPISFANVRKVQSKDTSMVAPEINSDDANESDGGLFRYTVKDFLEEDSDEETDFGDGLFQVSKTDFPYFDEVKPTTIQRKHRQELAGFPVVSIPSGEGKSELSCFKSFMEPSVYKQRSFSFAGSIGKTLETPKLDNRAADDFEMILPINRPETSPKVIIMKNTLQVLERKSINPNDLLFNIASIEQYLGREFLKSYRISVRLFKNEVELSCLLLMKGIRDISITAKFSADLSEELLELQRGKYYHYRGLSKKSVVGFLKTIEDKLKKDEKFDCTVCVGDYSFVIQALVLGYEFTLSKE